MNEKLDLIVGLLGRSSRREKLTLERMKIMDAQVEAILAGVEELDTQDDSIIQLVENLFALIGKENLSPETRAALTTIQEKITKSVSDITAAVNANTPVE
jgi:hypothetical protein